MAGDAPPDGPLIEIPTVYDGADLAVVAAHWGVTLEEAVALHSGIEYRVAFCGFAPGFGYLTGLPADRAVPRRATPRAAVPPGAVAVAGEYTGVYPRSSPAAGNCWAAPTWCSGTSNGNRPRCSPRARGCGSSRHRPGGDPWPG